MTNHNKIRAKIKMYTSESAGCWPDDDDDWCKAKDVAELEAKLEAENERLRGRINQSINVLSYAVPQNYKTLSRMVTELRDENTFKKLIGTQND